MDPLGVHSDGDIQVEGAAVRVGLMDHSDAKHTALALLTAGANLQNS